MVGSDEIPSPQSHLRRRLNALIECFEDSGKIFTVGDLATFNVNLIIRLYQVVNSALYASQDYITHYIKPVLSMYT